MKTDAEVVRDALDLLQRKGWTKRNAEDVHGHHCISGALTCAIYGVELFSAISDVRSEPANEQFRRLYGTVGDVIAEQWPGFWRTRERDTVVGPIPMEFWNDGYGRTFADVERVLEKTAVKLEEGGR